MARQSHWHDLPSPRLRQGKNSAAETPVVERFSFTTGQERGWISNFKVLIFVKKSSNFVQNIPPPTKKPLLKGFLVEKCYELYCRSLSFFQRLITAPRYHIFNLLSLRYAFENNLVLPPSGLNM